MQERLGVMSQPVRARTTNNVCKGTKQFMRGDVSPSILTTSVRTHE